ncbi:interleukin-12 subunit beta-like [Polyodon spathula]|uniref:interleukin-12 subunit beta-like n=1 Tax=Polyodon spathula TaxID=7913 RepID=UPI001B7E15A6|nr:interleukin-12 subunit beta-like [Polyodon spathula]
MDLLWSLLSIACLFLQLEGYTMVLKPNVVVVDVDMTPNTPSQCRNVTLQCGEQDPSVYWQRKKQKIGKGSELTICVEDFPDAGNFTCHNDNGDILNHTLVLIQVTKNDRGEHPKQILQEISDQMYIKCETKNYSGVFECSWNLNVNPNTVQILAEAYRPNSSISCTVHDQDKSRAICHELTYCPFQEEQEKVQVHLYAIDGPRFESYSNQFFLADIVTPEKIPIHKKDEGDKKVIVSWEYPNSWDKPHSYFPLKFEVKVLKNKNNCNHEVRSNQLTCNHKVPYKGSFHCFTEERSLRFNHSTKKYIFCLRAKDMYSDSPWSEWSEIVLRDPGQQCWLKDYYYSLCSLKHHYSLCHVTKTLASPTISTHLLLLA